MVGHPLVGRDLPDEVHGPRPVLGGLLPLLRYERISEVAGDLLEQHLPGVGVGGLEVGDVHRPNLHRHDRVYVWVQEGLAEMVGHLGLVGYGGGYELAHVGLHRAHELVLRHVDVLRVSSEQLVGPLATDDVPLVDGPADEEQGKLEGQGQRARRPGYGDHLAEPGFYVVLCDRDVQPREPEHLGHLAGHDHVVGLVLAGGVEGDGPGVILGDGGNKAGVEAAGESYCDVAVLHAGPHRRDDGVLKVLGIHGHAV